MNHEDHQSLLELNSATVYRSQQKVLEDFSLSISPGEHTAIVGPNGSGKSTLVQLLTKQLYPVASINGEPVVQILGKSRWNVAELRKHIGIVSMDLHNEIKNNLRYGNISGRDVVLSGFFSSMQIFNHQRVTNKMKAKADEALESMDAGGLATKKYSRMSSGEARRVLIARALVLKPKILILDEPTTALDFVAREKCLHHIRGIAQHEATVIIVTHHIEEIIPEINNVLLLKEGKVAFHGPKKENLTSEKIGKVFDHSVNVSQNEDRYQIQPEAYD